MAAPGSATELIVSAVQTEKGFSYDRPLADYATRTLRTAGIVADTPGGPLGGFDPGRISKLISILKPILAGQHRAVSASLRPDDVVTADYTSPDVHLPAAR